MAEPTAAGPVDGEPFDAHSPLPAALRRSWANRPVARRRIEVSRWYARFYAPLAVVSSVVGLMPLYDRVVTIGDVEVRVVFYGNLVRTAFEYDDGISLIGLALLAGLVGLLVAACVRVRTPLVPLGLAGLAAVALSLLILFDVHPRSVVTLSGAGVAAVVLAVWVLVLGVVHAVHLLRITSDPPTD